MANEIERKFRVSSPPLEKADRVYKIAQGYLNSDPHRTVRIRIKGKKGYITVKGIGNSTGVSRYEWEKRIPLARAEEMMLLVEPGSIIKTRYVFFERKVSWLKRHFGWIFGITPLCFEVDVFEGENAGLVLAEIELKYESQDFQAPDWLGEELTGDERYYNSYLAKNPYSKWAEARG